MGKKMRDHGHDDESLTVKKIKQGFIIGACDYILPICNTLVEKLHELLSINYRMTNNKLKKMMLREDIYKLLKVSETEVARAIKDSPLYCGAVVGYDGSVWVQTSNFPNLEDEEITAMIDEFDDPEESLTLTGLYIGGSKICCDPIRGGRCHHGEGAGEKRTCIRMVCHCKEDQAGFYHWCL
ncbi:uncharacterized protein LOC112533966 [Ricinus communis]|uniref:uncharacterized protein LOC112533966 n=1 Tax=Ricinus communis TaxID=3988 RepID=UPI000D699B47|nr:uncharacterized protein LOC112533966 [Ricinus communis]|eukprot:XP_025012280.1 uncharacterized protein LOC112533966 [Ricinus communis]